MTITVNGKSFEVADIYEDVRGARPVLRIKTTSVLTKEQADALCNAPITVSAPGLVKRTIEAYEKCLSCEIILTRASETEKTLAALTAERDALLVSKNALEAEVTALRKVGGINGKT